MRKKRKNLSLLEIMIVILIIGMVTGVLGYNMRGSLEKGKVFKTKQAILRVYELTQMQLSENVDLRKYENDSDGLKEEIKQALSQSGLVSKVSDLMKDGWGQPFEFSLSEEGDDLRIRSKKLDQYLEKNKKSPSEYYPWLEEGEEYTF